MPAIPPLSTPTPDELEATLQRALVHMTPDVDAAAVTEEVERRRIARRRAARRRTRVRVASAGITAVAACGAAVVLLHQDVDRLDTVRSTEATEAAGPAGGRTDAPEHTTSSTILPGQVGVAVEVPGRGPRVVGLGAPDEDGFWIARGDPLDSTDPVETTISHIGRDGTPGPTAEIAGVPLLAIEAGGELWVVAEDRVTTSTDPTRFRLKRIVRTTGEVLGSTPLELQEPLGLRAADGDVTLEARSGTATFDASGALVGSAEHAGELATATQVLHADGLVWVRTAADEVLVTATAAPSGIPAAGTSDDEAITLAGAGALVAAPAWSPGSVATTVRVANGLDLVELSTPDGPSPDLSTVASVPVLRTRLVGLPEDAGLVDVRSDVAWFVRGDRLAALPLA